MGSFTAFPLIKKNRFFSATCLYCTFLQTDSYLLIVLCLEAALYIFILNIFVSCFEQKQPVPVVRVYTRARLFKLLDQYSV